MGPAPELTKEFRCPRPLRRVHPLHVAIVAAGYRTYAEFARSIDTHPANLNAVLTGKHQSWPKFRRRCVEALGIPEAELFPEDEVA